MELIDVAAVVYSAGKVFDGLRAGRLDTENFLRAGQLDGIASRADLALLEDLRDAAQFVIDHGHAQVDAQFVRKVNATLTRSGPLHPGQLRRAEQLIGVTTPYGRHQPAALTDTELTQLIAQAFAGGDITTVAVDLFIAIAKAQPFEDGNKRTAIFAANAVLLGSHISLVVPFDENDPHVAAQFNDLLARAYVFDDDDAVRKLLLRSGIRSIRN